MRPQDDRELPPPPAEEGRQDGHKQTERGGVVTYEHQKKDQSLDLYKRRKEWDGPSIGPVQMRVHWSLHWDREGDGVHGG